MSIDMEQVREFAKLSEQERHLKTELDEVKAQKAKIETTLIDQFTQNGVQNINVDGSTVYLHDTIYGKAKDKEALAERLKEFGDEWNYLVLESVNSNSLSARIRELDVDEFNNPILPEGLEEVVECGHRVSVRATKKQ